MVRCFPSRIHIPSVAYVGTTFAKTLIDSIFKFYYVKVFLLRYQVTDFWFNVAQVVFMIWNAINDPLFGYIQDNSTSSILRVRRKSILYGAPFFVLTFVTFWFPWATDGSWVVGIHLMVSLCLYDALYTFVLLAQCALFAEMSTAHEDRLRLVLYDQIASLLGSWSVGACEFASTSLSNYSAFQFSTICFALLAWLGFALTGKYAKTEIAQLRDLKLSPDTESKEKIFAHDSSSSSSSSSIYTQTIQILRQRNFLAFVWMNFLQILHVTFYANFASIFLDVLFPADVLSSSYRSFFNGALFVLPQVLVLCLGPWLRTRGAHWVVSRSFFFKIALSAFVGYFVAGSSLFSERSRAITLLVFIMFDYAFGSAMFGTFNLLVSDVIDDDMKINRRVTPLSSSVFGTNALITKPAVSLAPMLVIYLLNPFGLDAFKRNPTAFMTDTRQLLSLQSATLNLIWTWPLVVGILQVLVFMPYNLRNTHESFIAKHVES